MGAMKKYAKLSQDFEKKHEEFKQHMQLLKCYEYHSQWATGSGVGFGSAGAGGKHLTRMLETDSMKTKSEPLFANTDGPGHKSCVFKNRQQPKRPPLLVRPLFIGRFARAAGTEVHRHTFESERKGARWPVWRAHPS